MAHLQPYLIFNAEATRINSLYWTSRYSYKKTNGILKLIADTGHSNADPRVDLIWNSNEIGLSSITTVPLSEFRATLEGNAESLRTTSILHICSAFENALCGYYLLGALYEPKLENPLSTYLPVPGLLTSSLDYQVRKNEILKKCETVLVGSYTKRIKLITKIWNLPTVTALGINRLNAYQKKRHLIAHDQGIANSDSPEKSVAEILQSRISIAEAEWKSLISDFSNVLNELDSLFYSSIVSDGGIALAIFRIIERDGPQLLSVLCKKIIDEWRTGNIKKARVRKICTSIGLTIKQVQANTYRVSR